MMTQLKQLTHPTARRHALTVVSGLSILAALVVQWLGLADAGSGLMIGAALLAGSDIAMRAWQALRHRHVSIELLVTVAAGGALLIGEYWEAAVVTFLFLFGAYLEARTLSQTRRALQTLLDVAPAQATVWREGREVAIAPQDVQVGETVLVKPGAKVPVDGEVLQGRATVDESPITGESMPVEKTDGSRVYAGTVSQNGLLWIQATGIGADTTLARIIRRVEEAQEAKAPTQRFIERFANWYTPGIIGLSVVVGVMTRDLELALTLLVIGCPGALVISTPVSIVAGIGRAAQRGILIKGGEYLEKAGKISAVAFDKTGTLTAGKPQLTDVIALMPVTGLAGGGTSDVGLSSAEEDVLHWAAIAEIGSEHPLARPIVAAAARRRPVPYPDDFEVRTGHGVMAHYQGRSITVGTPILMHQLGVYTPTEAMTSLDRLKTAGKTAVLVAVDGVVWGVLGIADTLRTDAAAMIRQLKASGVDRIVMLTGDDRRTAHAIAQAAGVAEVYAELLPEDKLTVIRQLQAEGHGVAMVGDGINDAPALAAADVGVAMGAAGTDVAIETADIALMTDNLIKIPEAIRLSKATLSNIRQNVFVALVTVSGLLVGVLLGEVHMTGGMFIHEASVLLVIFNAMRLLKS